MPSPIQNLIAAITGKSPKAKDLEVKCPQCGNTFEVDVDDDSENEKETWETDPETGISTGDHDPANEGADDDSELLNMTPKSRAERQSAIAQKILTTAKQRDFVGAKPGEIGPQKCIEIVADKEIIENLSPVDLLARELNKAAKEACR